MRFFCYTTSMTTDEFMALGVGDIVRVDYNGIEADYKVSAKDENGVEFTPTNCDLDIRYEHIDKWKISKFKLLKKAKK